MLKKETGMTGANQEGVLPGLVELDQWWGVWCALVESPLPK